jgi:hypothetical protein
MLRDMMSRFEKLETRVESGINKKYREVRKNSKRVVSSLDESVAGKSEEKPENVIFNHRYVSYI